MPALILYSRPECHLCEELLADLATLDAGAAAAVTVVDVDGDPALARRYGLRIPVLVCDGDEISGYPLDAERVRRRLAGAPP